MRKSKMRQSYIAKYYSATYAACDHFRKNPKEKWTPFIRHHQLGYGFKGALKQFGYLKIVDGKSVITIPKDFSLENAAELLNWVNVQANSPKPKEEKQIKNEKDLFQSATEAQLHEAIVKAIQANGEKVDAVKNGVDNLAELLRSQNTQIELMKEVILMLIDEKPQFKKFVQHFKGYSPNQGSNRT